MDDTHVVYRVYSMHGPTGFEATHAGFEALTLRVWQMSINAGPYRIIYLPTGEEVARYDRDMYGQARQGCDPDPSDPKRS